MGGGYIVIRVVLTVMFLLFLSVTWSYIGIIIRAKASGLSGINMNKLISMKMRKINPNDIILPAIIAKKADLSISLDLLESHHLANGNVTKVVLLLVAAKNLGTEMSFKEAADIDLSGSTQNLPEEVKQEAEALARQLNIKINF